MAETPARIRALNKENSLPTPAQVRSNGGSSGQAKRDAFERQLKQLGEQGDALQCWYGYITWASKTCDAEDVAGLLERACTALAHQNRYHDDPRLLRLWVRLASTLDDPLEVFDYLETCGIGVRHALLYEAWAAVLEKQHWYVRAESVYQSGLSRGAEPVARLEESMAAFNQRERKRLAREDVSVEELRAASLLGAANAACKSTSSASVECGVWERLASEQPAATTLSLNRKDSRPSGIRGRPSAVAESTAEVTTNCVRALLARSGRSSKASRPSTSNSVFEDPTCTMQLAKEEVLAMFGAPLMACDDGSSPSALVLFDGDTRRDDCSESWSLRAGPGLYANGGLPNWSLSASQAEDVGNEGHSVVGLAGGFEIYEDTDV